MVFASTVILMMPNHAKAQEATISIINPGPTTKPTKWNASEPLSGEIGTNNFTFYAPLTSVNSTFFINVTVTDADTMRGWQVGIIFENASLQYVSAWVPTDHVFQVPETSDWTFVKTFVLDEYDATHQIVKGVASYAVPPPPPDGEGPWTFNGTGVLCQIQFRIIKPVDSGTPQWSTVMDFDTADWTRIAIYPAGQITPDVGSANVNYIYDGEAPTIEDPTRTPSGTVQPNQAVLVSVNVTDTGTGVASVTLNYTTDNGATWSSLPMTLNATSGFYEASIPGQTAGTDVKYEIDAEDIAGNKAVNNYDGVYWTYHVVPEFTTIALLLVFAVTSVMAVVASKRMKAIRRI